MPETLYVTFTNGLCQAVTEVSATPTKTTETCFMGATYTHRFTAADLGRAIPYDPMTVQKSLTPVAMPVVTSVVGSATISGAAVELASGDGNLEAQVKHPSVPDTYMAKDDRMTDTAPRHKEVKIDYWVFARGVLASCKFRVDEVLGWGTSPPE